MRSRRILGDSLCIAFSAAVLLLFTFHVAHGGGAYVEVKGQEGTWRYSLEKDQELEVNGPLGVTVIQIKKGQARVLSSPCPGQQCVHMAPITGQGGFIACLPNRVLLSVVGDAEVDDVTN